MNVVVPHPTGISIGSPTYQLKRNQLKAMFLTTLTKHTTCILNMLRRLGVTTPNEVVVKVSKGIRNKGCGTGGARMIGPGEKAKNKAKTNQKGRACSLCDGFGHNMRTCGRNKSKGKEKVIEEFEDEEEGNENETSDHATSDTE
ncbi:hypothetical protein Tco_1495870 [Tanacetum coccineum]